jgi:hypothetical protein
MLALKDSRKDENIESRRKSLGAETLKEELGARRRSINVATLEQDRANQLPIRKRRDSVGDRLRGPPPATQNDRNGRAHSRNNRKENVMPKARRAASEGRRFVKRHGRAKSDAQDDFSEQESSGSEVIKDWLGSVDDTPSIPTGGGSTYAGGSIYDDDY